MRAFDHDFVNDVIARLNRVKPDATPLWGTMTSEQMIGHLIGTIHLSMGRGPEFRDGSNWFTTRILGPLVLRGIVKIPRNVKGVQLVVPREKLPEGDAETLHAVLESYLDLVQAGELVTGKHPVFGDIGVDGWARMHVHHFEHHLKQFGV